MSSEPLPGDTRALMLTSFAAAGDAHGVRRVLAADPGAVNELGLDGTSPLCAAAMWGQARCYALRLTKVCEAGL